MADPIAKTTQKILQCDEPSPYTGRVYPKEEVEKAVTQYKETIECNRAYGTFNSPNEIEINMANISHKLTSMKINENGEVIVDMEILDTPAGKQVISLIDAGLRLSPNMSGIVNDDGTIRDLTFFYTNWIPKSSQK